MCRQATIGAYRQAVSERYEITNEIYWMLDLSWVKPPEGGITLKNSWKIHPEDDRLITTPNKFEGNNVTVLLGVPWKFEGEPAWRAAMGQP